MRKIFLNFIWWNRNLINYAAKSTFNNKKDLNKTFESRVRKPNTSYSASKEGKKAFNEHLDALEKLINKAN